MSLRELVLFGTSSLGSSPRTLRAGLLSAVLEDGQLRRICWAGREAIRGIAFLIRNDNWGTYPAKLNNLHVEESETGFRITYNGHCSDDRQALDYSAEITGDAQGALSFRCHLRPTTDFSTNRAGFVVLHPLNGVAGEPVTVLHTDGSTTQSHFPKHIAPSQPLFDIRALTHEVSPGITVTCTMEGDAFEMEDQRNWSDASFKTYVRPLAKPFPYVLPALQEQTQAVSLRFSQTSPAPRIAVDGPQQQTLRLGPQTGRMPALALTLAGESANQALGHVQGPLRLLEPQWLVGRLTMDVRADELRALAAAQRLTQAQLWLEVVVPCRSAPHEELHQLARAAREAGLQVSAVTITPEALLKTVPAGFTVPGLAGGMPALLQNARREFAGALIGAGSAAYFTELNRNPPPMGAYDFVTHTTCPIIHAADDDSVMETLQALPWIFESTRQLSAAAPYWLGPTTIGMRHNPYGAAPAQNAAHLRMAMAKEDPRQRGLFGAAFYTAYAAAAARAGLTVMAFCDPTGPFGLINTEPQPQVFPAYHVFKWFAQAAGRPCLAVDNNPAGAIESVAYAEGSQRVLLLSNTTAQPQTIHLADVQAVSVAMLDETSVGAAADATWSLRPGVTDRAAKITLQPYAVARAILP
ncbi:MAG: hypothetical protein SF187_19685 [Deltaproteobacteria bacterium]|nr:hypothetical protein [Deltaproteobacteria bacterium]